MSKVESWGQTTERIPLPRRSFLPSGRGPLAALFASLLVLLAGMGGMALYASSFDGEIYRGVSVMGVDVSGKTPAQARELLLARAATYADAPLALRQGEQRWQVTPRQLGLSLDVDPLVQQAYSQGRAGSQMEMWRQRIPLLGGSTDIRPRYTLDQGKIEAYVQDKAREVYRAPVSSELTLRPDGKLVASQDVAGQRLDTAAAAQQLRDSVAGLHREDLTLPVLEIEAPRTREEWRRAAALREVAAAEPVRLEFRGREWRIGAQRLASAVVPAAAGEVVGQFDPKAMAQLLGPIAAEVRRRPVNAKLEVVEAFPVLSREKLGEKLDTAATARAIYAAIPRDRTAQLVTDPIPARLTAAHLDEARRKLEVLLRSPLQLRHGNKSWEASRRTLEGWIALEVSARERSATVGLKEAEIERYLAPIGEDVHRAPVDAKLAIVDAKRALYPEKPGEKLNTQATVRAIVTALSGRHNTALSMTVIPSRVTAANLEAAKRRLDTLLKSPVQVRFEGDEWNVPVETLAEWTTVTMDRKARTANIVMDAAKVRAWLEESVAPDVYIAPKDGALTWEKKLVVLRHSVDGRQLDVEGSTKQFIATAFSARHVMGAKMEVARPRVPTDNLAALGIQEEIGTGSSLFSGSTSERSHNVRTAATYLDNTVVAPGETFSFLDSIGWISKERGYKESLVILGDETVPGVGGGVCQVSTTTFRAAFWAGLPITDRSQHSNIVPYYELDGSPPGFDAAVYQPETDLQWVNNTGKYILVQSFFTEDSLKVALYGTDPNLEVTRSAKVYSREPALGSRTVVDPELRPGERKQVSFARPGVKVSVFRTVKKNGKVVDTDNFYSDYTARGDVWKVGPPKKLPPIVPPGQQPDPLDPTLPADGATPTDPTDMSGETDR